MGDPDEVFHWRWPTDQIAVVLAEDKGYRAGAAASEARIKALEKRIAELERRIPMDGLRCEVGEDGKTMKITIPGGAFLAPLKEADQ